MEAIPPLTPSPGRATRWSGRSRVSVVGIYWVLSIFWVCLNKVVLSEPHQIPLLVTWWQSVVTLVSLQLLGVLRNGRMPGVEIDLQVAKQMLPVALLYVATLLSSNFCLRLVQVSFYPVARSNAIAISAVLDTFLMGQNLTAISLACVVTSLTGFVVGCHQERDLSIPGVAFGASSSVFVVMNGVLARKGYVAPTQNSWRVMAYNNMVAIGVLTILLPFSGEATIALRSNYALRCWILSSMGGVLGVLVAIASSAHQRETTAGWNSTSSTIKATLQTLFALKFFGNRITPGGLLAVALVLLSSLIYTKAKNVVPSSGPGAVDLSAEPDKVGTAKKDDDGQTIVIISNSSTAG